MSSSTEAQQRENAKREAALIEAATIVLRSLPPTYPFSRPPPNSVILDSNPLSLSGQLSALFSLAANTSRRLEGLNNKYLSPLIGGPMGMGMEGTSSSAYDGGLTTARGAASGSDGLGGHYNYLGMTTNFGVAAGQLRLLGEKGAAPLYGKVLKPFILDYHYRNTTVVGLGPAPSAAVYGRAYVARAFGDASSSSASSSALPSRCASPPPQPVAVAAGSVAAPPPLSATSIAVNSSRVHPPLGILLSPNTQIVQRMRRAARKQRERDEEAEAEAAGVVGNSTDEGYAPPPRMLSVFSAELFLSSLQNDLLSLTFQGGASASASASGPHTSPDAPLESIFGPASSLITNVYTKPMAADDIRHTGVDVTHLFAIPSFVSSEFAAKSSSSSSSPTSSAPASFASASDASAAKKAANGKKTKTNDRYAFFAEVDMIEVEVIRVWRIDVIAALADAAESREAQRRSAEDAAGQQQFSPPRAGSPYSSKELLGFLATAAALCCPTQDPAGARVASAVLNWALGKGFGSAKYVGISVAERVGVVPADLPATGEEAAADDGWGDSSEDEGDNGEGGSVNSKEEGSASSSALYAVNVAAQLWTEKGMSAVTYRVGLSVDGRTLLPSLPHCFEADPTASASSTAAILPTSVLISTHVDVWLLVANHDWVPNTDMCKTHIANAFTVEEVARAVRRVREAAVAEADAVAKAKAVAVEAEVGEEKKSNAAAAAVIAPPPRLDNAAVLGAILDALHIRTIWACDERLCSEKDAKHVWLQHLRCQLPPTRNLFVFRESMPPQRPAFAKKQ